VLLFGSLHIVCGGDGASAAEVSVLFVTRHVSKLLEHFCLLCAFVSLSHCAKTLPRVVATLRPCVLILYFE
jgi:hypothetical protein